MKPAIYSVNVGSTVYDISQSEGSSRYNVSKTSGKGKRKFIRGYPTYEAARFYVDAQTPKRKLV